MGPEVQNLTPLSNWLLILDVLIVSVSMVWTTVQRIRYMSCPVTHFVLSNFYSRSHRAHWKGGSMAGSGPSRSSTRRNLSMETQFPYLTSDADRKRMAQEFRVYEETRSFIFLSYPITDYETLYDVRQDCLFFVYCAWCTSICWNREYYYLLPLSQNTCSTSYTFQKEMDGVTVAMHIFPSSPDTWSRFSSLPCPIA